MDVKIEESWKEVLKQEFAKPYFLQIATHLKSEKVSGKTIYPPGSLIFNAFNTTPFDKLKAVILGQDPYHGPGQAHGLSFSVPKGIPPPPSLINIFKELKNDLGLPIPGHGNLTHWAGQGVMLLNASLTVRANEPMSHAGIGWAEFTNAVIEKIARLDEPPEQNPVRKKFLEERQQWIGKGLSESRAEQYALFRVFGSKPGAYGVGLQSLIDEHLRCRQHHAAINVMLDLHCRVVADPHRPLAEKAGETSCFNLVEGLAGDDRIDRPERLVALRRDGRHVV